MPDPAKSKSIFTPTKLMTCCRRLSLQGMLATGFLAAGHWASGASTVTWTISPTSLQDGSGTWNTTTEEWWAGSSPAGTWTDSTPSAQIFAQFGGGTTAATTRNVTVGGSFNVAGLIFASVGGGAVSATNPGYVLTGGTITIQDGGTIAIGDNTSTSGQFVTINSVLAGNNLTIDRTTSATEQFLQLAGANTWTGTLTLSGGTGGLFVRSTGAAALNTLTTVVVPTTVTLDLQGTNTYTSSFDVAGVGDGTTDRGAIRFDNSTTVTGAIVMTGSAVLNFQSSTPTASNVVFTSGITQSGGSFNFTKTGLGTLTMDSLGTYTGETIVAPAGTGLDPGTMLLNFAGVTPAVTTNLLYNGLTPGTLVLGGDTERTQSASTGTLAVQGAASAADSQTFSNVTVTGPTAISAVSGAGGSVNVVLGAITRTAAGSTLSVTGPASGSITTTTNNGTLLGTWANYTSPSSVTTWAGVSATGAIQAFTGDLEYATGTNISALGGYSNASNLTIDSSSTGAISQVSGITTLNSITMADTTTSRVATVGAGNTLNLGAIGGIQLIAGAQSLTVGATGNAGTLNTGSAAGAELFLSNFDPTSILTINSVIANNSAGAVNVQLTGNGTTIFTGTNTYTGSTTISSGILQIQNNSALGTTGNTLVGGGATLQLAGGLTISKPLFLAGTGVSTNSGALESLSGNNTSNGLITMDIDSLITAAAGSSLTLFHTSATSTVITGTFNLTLGGAGIINVNSIIANSTGAVTKSGPGTVFLNAANTYSGSTAINGGILQISNAAGLGTTAAGTTVSSGAALQLTGGITVGAEALSINGSGVNNGGALESVSGNNSYGGAITLQTAAAIGSDANTLTLAGTAITGTFPLTFVGAGNIIDNAPITISTGTLTMNGSGTLTLNVANTYTGTTSVANGVLALGASSVLASTDPVTVNGGTFSLGTFSNTVGAVVLDLGSITSSTGVLTATSYNLQNGAVSAILAGTSGTVGVSKTSSNTVTLSSANTYTGSTTVSDGRLVLDYSGGNTVLPATDAITMSGGTLEVKGASGGSSVTLGAIATGASTGLSTLVVDASTALTATSLTRTSGAAMLIDLSAAGSSLNFTTAPAVTDGQITAGSGNSAIVMRDSNGRYDFPALGAGNSVVRLDATTALPVSGATASSPYVLVANGSTFSLSASETVSSLRIDTTSAGGALDLNGTTLNFGLLGFLNDGSNPFTITNSGSGGGLNGSNAVFIYQFGTGTLTLNASVVGPQTFLMGNGLINWTGASGNNGANYILGATVRLSGTGLTLNNSVSTGNGIGVLNIGNGGILELNTGNFTRPVGTSTNDVDFYSGDAGFSAFGTNQFVNLGGSSAALTWGSGAFLANGSQLILGSAYATAQVDFQNPLNLNGGDQTVSVLSPNTPGVGGKISGAITGAGGFTKNGPGILELSGANTYTAFTTVNAGTLLVSGSISGSTAVNVASGATLQLSGTGSVSAGTLSLAGNSTLSLAVGALTANTISLTGNATLNGSVTLALTLTGQPTNGASFSLINGNTPVNDGGGANLFVVNGTPEAEGSIFNITTGGFSQNFQLSYVGGSNGDNITLLAVVPEPTTLGTLWAAMGLTIGLTRLRRRRGRR